MDIISISFEEPLLLSINDELIKLIPFRTPDHGNVKFGIEASRSINIHREEIFLAIQSKQLAVTE